MSDDLINKSDKYWKNKLTPDQYRMLREKGTETAFSGKYNKHYEKGVYKCAGCGKDLFNSAAKYASQSGWPSFFEAIDSNKIELKDDNTLGMKRIEVVCDDEHYFGHCPVPGHENHCLNIRRSHWKVCDRCKIKWLIGENLFSSWREEGQDIWETNAERISNYEEVNTKGSAL